MPTFDGANLLITLDAGVTEIDAQTDLYQAWKDWQLLGNMRYPQAFRTIGGDALSGSINAGAYFFIQNQLGWRIRPPEEDITILLTGNLVSEDSTFPILIPTIGPFTVLVQGIQPITQNIDTLANEITYASFEGGISIDIINGVDGLIDPAGNRANPVKTLANAIVRATAKGFNRLLVKGNLTVGATETVSGYHIFGEGAALSALVITSGASTALTVIHEFTLTGALNGMTELNDTHIGAAGLTGFYGDMHNIVLVGDLSLVDSQGVHIDKCVSGIAGLASPSITVEGTGASGGINLRNHTGGVNFKGLTSGNVSIDVITGKITLDSTNVGGTIVCRGVADFNDQAGSLVTVDTGGLLVSNVATTGYDDEVHVDIANGAAGIAYPVGTQGSPVNNLADAKTIANKYNIFGFAVHATITLDRAFKDFEFRGVTEDAEVAFAGFDVKNSLFTDLTLSGQMIGPIHAITSRIDNVTDIDGHFDRCGFIGTNSIAALATPNFFDCYSLVPGVTTPTMDFSLVTTASADFRAYTGGLTIQGMTAGNISIDLISGHVVLKADNTGGTIVIRGVGHLTDNAGVGVTVNTDGLVSLNTMWAHIIEVNGNITSAQALSLLLAAQVGKYTAATDEFMDHTGTDVRIQSSSDVDGNRGTSVLTPSP